MTKQQAIEEHRKMWRWIAEETLKRKRTVEKIEYYYEYIKSEKLRNLCWCCEYDYQFKTKCYCEMCPIDFGVNAEEFMCGEEGSDYLEWRNETDYTKCAELAIKIANLPERMFEDEK